MESVTLTQNESGHAAFILTVDEEPLGRMDINIRDGKLMVFHTEVSPKAEGKGYAKLLLAKMVSHARAHALAVEPLCPFVLAQFKRHPESYADLWQAKTV